MKEQKKRIENNRDEPVVKDSVILTTISQVEGQDSNSGSVRSRR